MQDYEQRPPGWRPEAPLTEGPWNAPFGAGAPDRIVNDIAAKKAALAARRGAHTSGHDADDPGAAPATARAGEARAAVAAREEAQGRPPDVDWAEALGKDHKAEAFEETNVQRLVRLGALSPDEASALA